MVPEITNTKNGDEIQKTMDKQMACGLINGFVV